MWIGVEVTYRCPASRSWQVSGSGRLVSLGGKAERWIHRLVDSRLCLARSPTPDSQSSCQGAAAMFGGLFLVGALVAEHGPEDVDAPAGEWRARPGCVVCLRLSCGRSTPWTPGFVWMPISAEVALEHALELAVSKAGFGRCRLPVRRPESRVWARKSGVAGQVICGGEPVETAASGSEELRPGAGSRCRPCW